MASSGRWSRVSHRSRKASRKAEVFQSWRARPSRCIAWRLPAGELGALADAPGPAADHRGGQLDVELDGEGRSRRRRTPGWGRSRRRPRRAGRAGGQAEALLVELVDVVGPVEQRARRLRSAVRPNQPTSICPSACGRPAAPRWRASICAPRQRPSNGAPSRERHADPVGLGLDVLVGIVGAHRPAEDHRAGVVGKRLGQGIAEARTADVERVAAGGQAKADPARASSAPGAARSGPAAADSAPPSPRAACFSRMRTSRRHRKQLGHAPHHVVLEFVDAAVGIDQPPHHLDDALAVGDVEPPLEHAGEGVEVDRLGIGGLRRLDEGSGRRRVEVELRS